MAGWNIELVINTGHDSRIGRCCCRPIFDEIVVFVGEIPYTPCTILDREIIKRDRLRLDRVSIIKIGNSQRDKNLPRNIGIWIAA